MISATTKFLLTIAMLVLVAAWVRSQEPSAASKGKETKSTILKGVRLTVSVPEKVKAGMPVPVTVEIVNNGNAKAILGINRARPFRVVIKAVDKKGEQVPFTRYGKKLLKPTELLDILQASDGSFVRADLDIGETMDLSIPNLALFFDLTVPGEYTLIIEREVRLSEWVSGSLLMLSAKVNINIMEP